MVAKREPVAHDMLPAHEQRGHPEPSAGLIAVCWSYVRGSGLSKEGETAIDLLTKIMKIYSGEMQ